MWAGWDWDVPTKKIKINTDYVIHVRSNKWSSIYTMVARLVKPLAPSARSPAMVLSRMAWATTSLPSSSSGTPGLLAVSYTGPPPPPDTRSVLVLVLGPLLEATQ